MIARIWPWAISPRSSIWPRLHNRYTFKAGGKRGDYPGTQPSFYLSNAGAEIDLLLTWPNGEHWAIEIKRSTTPKLERGFYSACEDIQPSRKWLIYPGSECYPLGDGIEVMSLHGAMQALA